MKVPKPVTIDFETHGIEPRPAYPPTPVGVSIKYPRKPAKYYAFGHPTENNCGWNDAAAALEKAWLWDGGLLFQNAKFDIDVAEKHFNLPVPCWRNVHDTMFLLFLDDPHQTELSLKPSAARLLGMPPEEQDAVADWLIAHQPAPGVRISRSKNSDHYFGRYIALAPGKLVGKYGVGDVVRTEALFNLLYKKIVDRGMGDAYDRERRLMPILLEMERQGLPVDTKRLERDTDTYGAQLARIDNWIRARLRVGADCNLDSGEQLVNAMVKAGAADPHLLPRTPKTGKFQSNKEALIAGVTDKTLLAVLKYRTQLNTCMNTFMLPWLDVATKSRGLIYTTWNQVKSPRGDDSVGTRTGRLSSTPNFQNIPKEFAPIFSHEARLLGRELVKRLPKCPLDLPPLPKVRSYVTPFPGEVLIGRDYSQQELRILAHFDGGDLLHRYNVDPWMDVHDYAKLELEKMGLFYDRKPVKNTNFGLIYGMGQGKLAEKNGMTVEDAAALKRAVLTLYPGLSEMYRDMRVRSKSHQPIKTWGGREYYCEEPKIINGRVVEFDYKMVNVLIQGSAADCTKEALIRHYAAKDRGTRLLLTVHDEMAASTARSKVKAEMEAMRIAMESVEFDVPMLSEGFISRTNWGELQPYDKKGKIVYATKTAKAVR